MTQAEKRKKQVADFILKGNLLVTTEPKSDKYCSYCGRGNKATRKHEHILFNDHGFIRNRRARKAAQEWKWE